MTNRVVIASLRSDLPADPKFVIASLRSDLPADLKFVIASLRSDLSFVRHRELAKRSPCWLRGRLLQSLTLLRNDGSFDIASLRSDFPIEDHQSSERSRHSGFMLLINSCFFALDPPFNCFSLAIAAFMSPLHSKYTSFVSRYFEVNFPPMPSLCSWTRRARLLVVPIYRTVLYLLVMM